MIVYVDMVADLFHSGHVEFLKKISLFGTVYVGLNSDLDVASYKRIPIISLEHRTTVVEACKYVHKVIAPCPLVITEDFMNQYKIDLVIHAHDEGDTRYDFMYKVPIALGKFKRIDYHNGISTTEIINKIRSN